MNRGDRPFAWARISTGNEIDAAQKARSSYSLPKLLPPPF